MSSTLSRLIAVSFLRERFAVGGKGSVFAFVAFVGVLESQCSNISWCGRDPVQRCSGLYTRFVIV